MTTKYGVNIFSGSDNEGSYFMVEFVKSGFPSHYSHITTASKKRLETLISTWDKRVYFSSDGVMVSAFNPNA